jgi:prepilin-type N-terminal cleavage/methylation domain-containing protein
MNRTLSNFGRHSGAPRSTEPNGFTLMELLIVIAIILILMLMAIPTIGSLKKQANETSAIQSIRAISQALSPRVSSPATCSPSTTAPR